MHPLPCPPGAEPRFPRWVETLRDRTQVVVRPIHASDRAAEDRFIRGLPPEAGPFRFLGHVGQPGTALPDRLTRPDPASAAAFVAMAPDGDGDGERIVGVSRYASDADGMRCECVVAVADAWRDLGLEAALMRHLVEVARSRGIATLYCIDRGSTRMADLALRLGFRARLDPDDPTLQVHELQL